MGHKETSCIANEPYNSMEQKPLRVRPALLKRKSLDTSDNTKPSNHRRNKSQQVRFKEDSTSTTSLGCAPLVTEPGENVPLVNGRDERCHNISMCLLANPESQCGLQNIAIQTSPSLRKHFPSFKTKKLIASNPIRQFAKEPSCFLSNGDLSEEEVAAQLSHLRIVEQLEDGFKHVSRHGSVKQTLPKAQSNGPISESSESESVELFEKVPAFTLVPDNKTENTSKGYGNEYSERSHENTSQTLKVTPAKQTKPKHQQGFCHSKQSINEESSPSLKTHIDLNRTASVTPSFNSSVCNHLHSEHQQLENSTKGSESEPRVSDNQAFVPFPNNTGIQTNAETVVATETNTNRLDSSQPCSGIQSISCFPKSEEQCDTNKESKEGNQSQKAHGEFCSLQGKLQTIEESLQSNKEKIKILLNVIQDLEKARALNEGRNFYRTGQDLNNCSTCQSTACIIYSVEYDFRQQEGRFLHILKMLDEVEQSPVLPPVQKPEPDNVIPEKQDFRKKAKKVKKKCFWWI
ncbi:hypothetical protein XENTR_v10008165 [Xenopus tropicalis]|uniref:Inhibitory synaptic factor family member 2B n=1 Tax=Xenopus tropicalis TaxID=8364 RepID=F6XT92_XENTR|nr:protein INSYN2B [Xenopus tropicalis]KAE8614450.1 hypothetical protein XENTR_v10008165 [Xenopus tropicalis]|eukprot:XP_012815209.1 PREDICTED: protein FAM196B [Xenopus tropicalis]